MGTYFDAVLDITYKPIVNDVEAEVKKWVEEHKHDPRVTHYTVCVGKTMELMTLDEYLARK